MDFNFPVSYVQIRISKLIASKYLLLTGCQTNLSSANLFQLWFKKKWDEENDSDGAKLPHILEQSYCRTHSWGVYRSIRNWVTPFTLFDQRNMTHPGWADGADAGYCGAITSQQSVAVAKVMWWLAGNRYPTRAGFWSVNQTTAWIWYQSKSHWKQSAGMIHPRTDRGRDRRKRIPTCRRYQTWCGIHYHISPSEDVTCHFTLLRVLIILHHVQRKLQPRWHERTQERGLDFILCFANELLDELIESLD